MEARRPARPPPPGQSVSSVQSSSQTFETASVGESFETFDSMYKQCFSEINSALLFDETGDRDSAISLYLSTTSLIEKTLSLSVINMADREQEYDDMIIKIKKAKLQIESRLKNLQRTDNQINGASTSNDIAYNYVSQPPSYEVSISSSVGDEIMSSDRDGSCVVPSDAVEMFKIEDGVQIYFITNEGYVSAPSYPSSLHIYSFSSEDDSTEKPPGFLQIGPWYYPLMPGISPSLQTEDGCYIFPDTTQPDSGCSIGLILSQTVSEDERETFLSIIHSMTVLRHRDSVAGLEEFQTPVIEEEDETNYYDVIRRRSDESMSGKVSRGIINAANLLSRGITYGAEKAGQLIRSGSNKVQSNLTRESDVRVPEKYQKNLAKAREASHVAVTVSSFLVKKLGDASVYLGKKMAPYIIKHGGKVLPKSVTERPSGSGKSTLDDVMEVAGSSIVGFSTVYTSLEKAALALGKSLADETVNIVTNKYGSEAGQLTENSLYSAGNVAMAGYAVNHLGVKAIAKKAAKDTGKAVLEHSSQNQPL